MSLGACSIENSRANDSPEYHTHLQGAISEQRMRWILAVVFMIDQIKVTEDAVEYHRHGQQEPIRMDVVDGLKADRSIKSPSQCGGEVMTIGYTAMIS